MSHPDLKKCKELSLMILNFLFILINLFNYIDRGFISSLDTTFVEQYNITDTTSGFINSSFIIGYLVFSPLFSILVKKYNKIILIFIGLTIWAGFNILNSFFDNIYVFIILRSFIGVGEASYGTIVPTLVDKLSNDKTRSIMLASYFLAMPLGFALGFIISGFLRQYIDWHYLFLIEGCCVMILNFFLLCFVKKIKNYEEAKHIQELSDPLVDIESYDSLNTVCYVDSLSLKEKVLKVVCNRHFMIFQFGYIFYTFLIGSFSYWGPGYMVDFYNYSVTDANYVFGGFTVGSGIIGSLSGGILLDFLKNKYGNTSNKMIKIRLGNMLILSCLVIGYVCCSIIFLIKDVTLFFCLFAIAELCLFVLVGPINSILLWSLESKRYTDKLNNEIKVIGSALSICLIHLLGDVPSPILTGYIYDHTENWNLTFFIISQFLILGIGSWIVTLFIKPYVTV